MFDDKYIKCFQLEVTQCEEILPTLVSKTSPTMTFDDDYSQFFDGSKRAINSEAKATENEGNKLLKIIDKEINDVEVSIYGESVSCQNDNGVKYVKYE